MSAASRARDRLHDADAQDERAEDGQVTGRRPAEGPARVAMVVPCQERCARTGNGNDAADLVERLDVEFHGRSGGRRDGQALDLVTVDEALHHA